MPTGCKWKCPSANCGATLRAYTAEGINRFRAEHSAEHRADGERLANTSFSLEELDYGKLRLTPRDASLMKYWGVVPDSDCILEE